jgi:hypothetical protein
MSIFRITAVVLLMCLATPAARPPSLAATLDASFGEASATRPQPGDRFPAFTLPSLADETPISIVQFRGRKVLLHQFASW